MERLTHERSNGIKKGFWSPATKEELVQRLAAYENTGYAPEELVTAQNAALQAAMDRLGEFGRLFVDYKGCPRGPMGRMAGVSLVEEALYMPEIVDVDGGRWIPVQADVLHELCEQAKSVNGAPVQHGHWEWYEEWSESNPDHYSELEDTGWRCSQCKVGLGDYISDRVREAVYADNMLEMPNVEFCPHCGAKMDEEDNDG